jgi:hypothetical protein
MEAMDNMQLVILVIGTKINKGGSSRRKRDVCG